MTLTRRQKVVLATFGFLAPFWWTWSVNQLIYGFYVVGGRPDRPSRLFAWTSIIVASFALGVLTGFGVFLLCRTQPLQAWLVFVGFVVFGLVVFALLVGSSSVVTNTFASPGDLTFLAGSL